MAAKNAKTVQFSQKDVALQLTAALRRTSLNPTIFGYKAQEHQIQFHSSPKVGRLFLGGNRAGKTVAGAAEMVMWLTGQHQYQQLKFKTPIRARAIAVDFENGVKKIVQPEIARWIPPSQLKNGSWEDSYEKSSRTLTLVNGSTLEFMSYDQDKDKFAGTSRHLVWFDEEPPEGIFNENLLRLADVGGHWMMTMTPLIDMSWTIDRLYEPSKEGQNPNIDVFEVNTSMNKYVSQTTLDILLDGLDEDEKIARQSGKYTSFTGAIYRDAVTPDNLIPTFFDPDSRSRWDDLRRNWGHFGMLDHGFTNPTAFLFGAFDGNGRVVIYDEYYYSNRLVKENAVAILKRYQDHGVTPQYIVGDPSTQNTDPIVGHSIQSEYAQNGLSYGLANNDVKAGIERVFSRFKENQLFIARNCEKTIWELGRYRWAKFATEKTAAKNNSQEVPMKKNDHAMDALRYGIVSRPALSGEVDLPRGNVLNASVAITEQHPLIDDELIPHHVPEQLNFYDPELGTDF